jgi:hypothetical protein
VTLSELRDQYHKLICAQIIRSPKGYPNFADSSSQSSREIAWRIVRQLGWSDTKSTVKEQTAGKLFENLTSGFLQSVFTRLIHLRPGNWYYSTSQTSISKYEQYAHLAYVDSLVRQDAGLASALGGDYIVHPDIVIARVPVDDAEINKNEILVNPTEHFAHLTPYRIINRSSTHLILHASISCKWTIRSDRSQNTRTEALNLIRNRKGHLAHIVAVTAEPLPTRIATLALGTGDLDCVYHFALPELEYAIKDISNEDQYDMLRIMIDGNRLRDISDLPFDLAM